MFSPWASVAGLRGLGLLGGSVTLEGGGMGVSVASDILSAARAALSAVYQQCMVILTRSPSQLKRVE